MSEKLNNLLHLLHSKNIAFKMRVMEKVTITDPCCENPNICACDPRQETYHTEYREINVDEYGDTYTERSLNPYFLIVEIRIEDEFLLGRYPLPWFRQGRIIKEYQYELLGLGRIGKSRNRCVCWSNYIPSTFHRMLEYCTKDDDQIRHMAEPLPPTAI